MSDELRERAERFVDADVLEVSHAHAAQLVRDLLAKDAAKDAEITRLKLENAKDARAHLGTIDERDAAQEAADELAYAIAPLEVIGEHSNLNDPWRNAVEALDVEREQHAEALGRMQVSFSAEEQRADDAEAHLTDLQQRIASLREYVQHKRTCPQSLPRIRLDLGPGWKVGSNDEKPCTCGLAALVTDQTETKP